MAGPIHEEKHMTTVLQHSNVAVGEHECLPCCSIATLLLASTSACQRRCSAPGWKNMPRTASTPCTLRVPLSLSARTALSVDRSHEQASLTCSATVAASASWPRVNWARVSTHPASICTSAAVAASSSDRGCTVTTKISYAPCTTCHLVNTDGMLVKDAVTSGLP